MINSAKICLRLACASYLDGRLKTTLWHTCAVFFLIRKCCSGRSVTDRRRGRNNCASARDSCVHPAGSRTHRNLAGAISWSEDPCSRGGGGSDTDPQRVRTYPQDKLRAKPRCESKRTNLSISVFLRGVSVGTFSFSLSSVSSLQECLRCTAESHHPGYARLDRFIDKTGLATARTFHALTRFFPDFIFIISRYCYTINLAMQ